MSVRKVALNTIALAGVQGANLLIPLLVLPYLAILFGANLLGELVYIQSIMALGIMLVEFGFGWSLTKVISSSRGSMMIISDTFSAGIVAQILLSIIFALLCALSCALFVEHKFFKSYFYAYISVFSSALIPMWLFQGLEKLVVAALIQLVGKAMLFPMLYFYVDIGGIEGVELSLMCFSISSMTTSIIILIYIKTTGVVYFNMPKFRDVYILLCGGFSLFVSKLLISLYTLMIPLVLGLVAGSAQLAYFSVAEKIKIALQALLSPLSQALFPRINILYEEGSNNAVMVLKKVVLYSFCIAVLAAVAVNIYAAELVLLLGGGEFMPSVAVLRVLSIAPLFIVVSSVLGVQVLVAKGFNQVFLKILGAGSVLSMIMVYPVANEYHAVGVAWLVVFVELLIALLMLLFVYRVKLHL